MPIANFKKKNLLLIGPCPPPYGGVSNHIKRLAALLKNDFDISFIDESKNRKTTIFNIRSFKPGRYIRLIKKSDIIHVHSGHYIFRLIHFLSSKIFRKKIIFTLHSYAEKNKGSFEKYIDRLIFKNSKKVVFVNEETFQKFSIPDSYLKEAFLPPLLNDEEILPTDISNLIKIKKANGYLISCANAWRLDLYNNEDLYGLDLCIEAAKYCKENNIKIVFLFIVSDLSGKLPISSYKKLIKDYDLCDVFFLYDISISFVRLIIESDIVLRPTNTDGDALTIREGLFFEKKVIASDIVSRPDNTYLFETRNIASFIETIEKVYGYLIKKKPNQNIIVDSYIDYFKHIDFYKNTLYT